MSLALESVNTVTRLPKAATCINGLDAITQGGLPSSRATLICGGPGCGKTILAMEFLARGARDLGEPGLFVSFEESTAQLLDNFRSLGFGLEELIQQEKLKISHVQMRSGDIIESGAFSLDALIIRIQHGINEVGAKRVVLDTMETLFAACSDTEALRTEIARLFHWLREIGVTALVTGERGNEGFTRHGFEEYLSDCVILLDHRVNEGTSKRRLRVVKYRGSSHAADEFPFLIGETGISVIPITSLKLNYRAFDNRVSTGVKDIDESLGGHGYFKATTVLINGRAGTGKSSLAASFVVAACERGERCLYFSFEESEAQLTRNMKSIGIDLDPWLKQGLLVVRSFRPTLRGLEEHLVCIAEETEAVDPWCVVLDPITNFITVGDADEIKSMLTRIVDLLKHRGVTLLMTALMTGTSGLDESKIDLSSLVDTWIALDIQSAGQTRQRSFYVVKSRGMEHSHETRELVLSPQGVALRGRTVEATS